MKPYVSFIESGIKVDLKRYLKTPEGKAVLESFAKKTKSQYNFKNFDHQELIDFALKLPKDIERTEYIKLAEELGRRLKLLKNVVDRF